MPSSLSRSGKIEAIATTVYGVSAAASIWKPAIHWPIWFGTVVLFLAIVLQWRTDTPADRERRRRGAWVIPLIMLMVAAQVVYLGSADDRVLTMGLASGLVVAGLALFWAHRRAV